MIQGLNRLIYEDTDTSIPENCRKSRPGLDGTSPGAQIPKIQIKNKMLL